MKDVTITKKEWDEFTHKFKPIIERRLQKLTVDALAVGLMSGIIITLITITLTGGL